MKIKGAAALFLWGVPASAWAGTCALCREALRSGGSAGLLDGFYWSIVLIVPIPLLVIAVGLRYIWKSYR